MRRTWGRTHRIYHNLPFLNVFNPHHLIDRSAGWRNLKPLTLSKEDLSGLKKTSIDYTLCDNDDTPVLCIEFDGLQEGFNVGTTYHPKGPFDPYLSPWRQQITELKLKVAYGSMFPYFVVGSSQFNDIDANTKLTIVDGIIGTILAGKATSSKFTQGFDPTEAGYSQEDFEHLSKQLQHEIVQDWVIGVEVDSEFQHNPITRQAWKLFEEINVQSHSVQYLQYPDIDPSKSIEERIKLIESTVLEGCKVTYHTDDLGDVKATAWLPNFKAVGFSGLGLAEDIAMLLAASKVRRMRKAKE